MRSNYYFYLLILFLILFQNSCSSEKKDDINFDFYVKKINDKAYLYLFDRDIESTDFKKYFYFHFEEKIKQHKIEEAAIILDLVSSKQLATLVSDQKIISCVENFLNHYSNKISGRYYSSLNCFLGDECYNDGSYQKAISYYKKACSIVPYDYFSCDNIAFAYYGLGGIYSHIGEQKLSLQYNNKALYFYRKCGNKKDIGLIYLNLAVIHRELSNEKEVEINLNKAIWIFKKNNDTLNLFASYFNKIEHYKASKNPKTFPLIEKVYKLYMNNSYDFPADKIDITCYYSRKLIQEKKFKDAKILLDNIKKDVEQLNLPNTNEEFLISISNLELEQNIALSQLKKINEMLREFQAAKQYSNTLVFANLLKKDAFQKNDFKNALYYSELFEKAKDAQFSSKLKLKVTELDKKHQVKRKEQQITIQKKTIKYKNTSIILLITSFIAFIFLSLIILSRQKLKKLKKDKANSMIYTKKLIEKTEQERKRIAADLHDSVSHDLLNLKHSIDTSGEDYKSKIDSIINEIRIISRNLHPVMFDKIGLKFSIEQLVERTQINHNFMVSSEINYINKLSTEDELQIYRIIQEALTNIIKYSNALAAKIIIEQTPNMLLIEIKDNGTGFNVNDTLNNKDSFGLHNIIERCRHIGGKAKIISDKNGTIITIKI